MTSHAFWPFVALGLIVAGCAQAQGGPPAFIVERTIALPDVRGRIDHLAIDPAHRHLAVAELENRSVEVVDLQSGVIRRIIDVGEPQGLAFDQSGALLLVAERADGALRVLDAQSFEPVATITLGDDADDVRLDPRNGHAIVGYGDGALAVVDLQAKAVLRRIDVPAHPEGFQSDPHTGRTFVNLPDRRTIGVVDLDNGALLSTWRLPLMLWNYPMALDPDGSRIAVAFRGPARLALFSLDGALLASEPTCGDSDDLFFDTRRHRLYLACGEGAVDTFDLSGTSPHALGRTPTSL